MKKLIVSVCTVVVLVSIFSFTDKKELIGKWNMMKTETFQELDNESGEYHDFFKSGAISFLTDIPDDSPNKKLAMMLEAAIPGVGTHVINQVLKDITFQEDGNVILTYSAAGFSTGGTAVTPVWQNSAPGAVTYKIEGDKIRLSFDMEKLMPKDNSTDNANATPSIFSEILKNGLLLNYRVKNNTAYLYLDKEFLSSIVPMLTAMAPTLQDTDLDGMAGLFKKGGQKNSPPRLGGEDYYILITSCRSHCKHERRFYEKSTRVSTRDLPHNNFYRL